MMLCLIVLLVYSTKLSIIKTYLNIATSSLIVERRKITLALSQRG